MQLFTTPSLFAAIALMLLPLTPAQSAPLCPDKVPLPLVADGIPPDDDVCGDRDLQSFAHMAWQTFKILVWPAASRGEADDTRRINDMSGPRVFETYKSDWEIFPTLAPGQSDWGTYPSEAAFCKGYSPAKPTRFPDGLVFGSMNKFDSVDQPGDAIGQVLMAQNGSLVRYLAAFNEKAFVLIKNLDRSINFPPSEADPTVETKADDGTITIKSAWIEIKNSIPDPSRFHVRSAWVQDPSGGDCKEARVALVGLHIVHKTRSSQQWVWASFEHVNNSPLRGDPPTGGFTFNHSSGVPMPFAPPLDSRTRPPSMSAPYNVERLYEIASDIRNVNAIWQQALQGSVWTNYQLVVVQWPGKPQSRDAPTTLFGDHSVIPSPPCRVAQPHANTANTVMETFLQSTPGTSSQDALNCSAADERTLGHTCMGCHYQAHNYDFIWAIPLNRRSGDASADARNRGSALSALRRITGWSAR